MLPELSATGLGIRCWMSKTWCYEWKTSSGKEWKAFMLCRPCVSLSMTDMLTSTTCTGIDSYRTANVMLGPWCDVGRDSSLNIWVCAESRPCGLVCMGACIHTTTQHQLVLSCSVCTSGRRHCTKCTNRPCTSVNLSTACSDPVFFTRIHKKTPNSHKSTSRATH